MKYLFCLLLLATSAAFSADMTSAAGDWITIDDTTGKPASVMRITQVGNELRGSVLKIMDPAMQNAICDKCNGANKNKPIIGLTVMWGLKKVRNGWAGGTIMDPDNGKSYRAKMALVADGKKLSVRGFIGFSLFGRSQTWIRK